MARAMGREVDLAWNHNDVALAMHRMNHPGAFHLREDAFAVDPIALIRGSGKKWGAGWFSPSCTNHSKAKGGKPKDRRDRCLSIVMLKWAKAGCRVMYMENVEEIMDWGPLVRRRVKGRVEYHPDKKQKGRSWKAMLDILQGGVPDDHPDLDEFVNLLEGAVTREEMVRGFGYHVEFRKRRAADSGAPTTRTRLFMVCRNDGQPIVWPEQHFFPAEEAERLGKPSWRPVASCLDWSIPCPSIFLRGKAAKAAKCKRPLVVNTERRCARGVDKFVLKAARPFLVNLTHGGRLEDIDQPAKTVTGARRGEKAVVMPVVAAPFITEHANGSNQRLNPADRPLGTICAQPDGGHFAVASSVMVNTTGHPGAGLGSPTPTITTGGHQYLMGAALVPVGYGERDGQAPRCMDANKPLSTVVAAANHHALAVPVMVKLRGKNTGSPADEPLRTVSAGGQHHAAMQLHLAAGMLSRDFGQSVGGALDQPAPTVMGSGLGKTKLVQAEVVQGCFMAQHNGGGYTTDGRRCDMPLSAVTTTGSQQGLIAASAVCYYGTEQHGQPVDSPARTTRAKDCLALVTSNLAELLTPEQLAGARRVAKFLRRHGVEFEGEFAMVGPYVIVDIGMRMLTPSELFAAQGFPNWGWMCYGTACRTTIAQKEHASFVQNCFNQTVERAQAECARPAAGLAPTRSDFRELDGLHDSELSNPDCAASVESPLPLVSTATEAGFSKHVDVHVHIDLGRNILELRSARKYLSGVSAAVESERYPLPTEIAGSVRCIVQALQCEETKPRHGKVELKKNNCDSTSQLSGGSCAGECGSETLQRVDVAVSDISLSVEVKNGRSIISEDGRNSQSYGSLLETLFCFVASAMASSTLNAIKEANSFGVSVEISERYIIDRGLFYINGRPVVKKLSKTAQVRMVGNSVSPMQAEDLFRANSPELCA